MFGNIGIALDNAKSCQISNYDMLTLSFSISPDLMRLCLSSHSKKIFFWFGMCVVNKALTLNWVPLFGFGWNLEATWWRQFKRRTKPLNFSIAIKFASNANWDSKSFPPSSFNLLYPCIQCALQPLEVHFDSSKIICTRKMHLKFIYMKR